LDDDDDDDEKIMVEILDVRLVPIFTSTIS
jgi:hypothetical protein